MLMVGAVAPAQGRRHPGAWPSPAVHVWRQNQGFVASERCRQDFLISEVRPRAGGGFITGVPVTGAPRVHAGASDLIADLCGPGDSFEMSANCYVEGLVAP